MEFYIIHSFQWKLWIPDMQSQRKCRLILSLSVFITILRNKLRRKFFFIKTHSVCVSARQLKILVPFVPVTNSNWGLAIYLTICRSLFFVFFYIFFWGAETLSHSLPVYMMNVTTRKMKNIIPGGCWNILWIKRGWFEYIIFNYVSTFL